MATLKEVAELAGVSPITVSRVVNNPEAVKEKTRIKVKDAMRELKYVPNVAAKSLATNRCGVIDVYIPENIELSNPFAMYLLAGVSQVLSDHYYSFLILRNRKREHNCDGYIVTGLLKNEIEEFAAYAEERNRPVVLFGHTDRMDVDCIDVDNLEGARKAVQHLISKGHRRIAMFNVNENKDYTLDRLEGYKLALQENGIAFNPNWIISTENSVKGGEIATEKLMQDNHVTAIFCATDIIAIGAAARLKSLNYKIPTDISLIGFDGFGHQRLATPTLTTIRQPIYDLGMMLATTLLERLDGRTEKTVKMVPPELLPGASDGPCHSV